MGYGIAAAGGLEAAQQGLRQRLMDQMLQKKQEQDMQIQSREQALREQEAARKAEEFKLTIAERQKAMEDRSHAGDVANAGKLAPELPMNQNVSPQAGAILDQGGLGGQLYAPPTMGQTETGKPFVSAQQNPRVNLGTQPQQVMGRLLDSLPANSAERRALEYEQGTGKNAPAGIFDKPAKPTSKPVMRVDPRTGKLTNLGEAPADAHFVNEPPPPQAPQPIVIQTASGPQLVNRGTGTASPITDQGGATVGPAPSATERTRAASATAVLQTGDDIVSELQSPDFAAKIGPALGRFNSLRDFIGSPPPEFSQLAGQIESYALASMGVHGMRSVQGSEKIKALLDTHHTPESLIGAIKGLNGFSEHFVKNQENQGAKSARQPSTPGGKTRTRYDINGNVIP